MGNEKRQIIIVGSGIPDMITKMAITLRKKRYKTIFISLVNNPESDLLKKAYDKVISFNAKFFKINLFNFPEIFLYNIKRSAKILEAISEIRKLKPYVVIGVATPNWLCYLAKRYFKNYPFIYFPFDIRSFSYADLKEAISSGVQRFEINAEKYCFKNADGIIHKGGEDELDFLNDKVLGEKIHIKCPTIHFFPYCLEEFIVPIREKEKLSHKDNGIHIVHVGHTPAEKMWHEGAEIITNQKIFFHLYSKTANLTKEEEAARISKSISVSSNRFLCFHQPVPQKELSSEISKYDYGIYGYKILALERDATDTGNKISSYLEAGLPIICPESYKAVNKHLQKHNAAVVIKHSQLKELKKILEKNKPGKLKKGILKTRSELSMRKHIPRLEKFFEQVVKSKR